jgi:hypothetical protein
MVAALTRRCAGSPGEAVVVVTVVVVVVVVVVVPVSDGVGSVVVAPVHAPQSRIADNTKRLISKSPIGRSRAESIGCRRKLNPEPVLHAPGPAREPPTPLEVVMWTLAARPHHDRSTAWSGGTVEL